MHINCLRTRRFSLHRQERNQNRTLVSASFSFLVERGEASLATKENKTPHISKKKERIRFECTSAQGILITWIIITAPFSATVISGSLHGAQRTKKDGEGDSLRSPYTSEGLETPQSIHLMNPISCVRKPAELPPNHPLHCTLDCGRTLPHIIRKLKGTSAYHEQN